ncbi:nuclear transport factor 2 family protein [Arthrobacter sp. NPDC093128]|uniref:nuclear transport factor 2 family protein n=1 Tax=Arthrobacter sp. NPDC093128 TaxID=3154979 RepID=UPI0034463A91
MAEPNIDHSVLAALVDRQSIWDCMLRYTRGVDRVDEQLIRSAFWDDAHDAHGGVNGPPEDFLAWFLPNQTAREVAQHIVTNHSVELRGEQADTETYFVSVAKKFGSDTLEQVGGRYLDLFEKRGSEWRIKNRLVLLDWQCVGDASQMSERLALANRGSRDRKDPSYTRPIRPLPTRRR